MLEEILRHLNNWFPVEKYAGTFTVEEGGIALPFLQSGQYFRVMGSVFNDGLYQYPAAGLTDEVFEGTVWALAIPKAVLALAEEIQAWQEKNGDAAASPFTTESFGGYSYTKASIGGANSATWQSVFKGRLNAWRRMRGV